MGMDFKVISQNFSHLLIFAVSLRCNRSHQLLACPENDHHCCSRMKATGYIRPNTIWAATQNKTKRECLFYQLSLQATGSWYDRTTLFYNRIAVQCHFHSPTEWIWQKKKQFCQLWSQGAIKITSKHSLTIVCVVVQLFKTSFYLLVASQIKFGGMYPLAFAPEQHALSQHGKSKWVILQKSKTLWRYS